MQDGGLKIPTHIGVKSQGHKLNFVKTLVSTQYFLYARLKTGHMVWWCPFVRPGLRPPVTVFCTFLLYALTYWAEILHVTSIKFECPQFSLIFVGVLPLLELKIQFSAVFPYMHWHIALKFCIWICFTVLQIKFECHQFASIFVGVLPLLEFKILEIHSFPQFSPTCFDILRWNFAYEFVLLYYRSSLSVINLRQFL